MQSSANYTDNEMNREMNHFYDINKEIFKKRKMNKWSLYQTQPLTTDH